MSFPTDESGKIIPIDWATDRHTRACQAAGLPTPWTAEYDAALAAQEQAQAAAAVGATVPPGADPQDQTPNVTAWLGKSMARFGHHAARAACNEGHQPDPASKNPNLDAWLHRCKARFAPKVKP